MLWNERFAFGIETIDNQHKNLFNLIERAKELLKEADSGKDCYAEIIQILNELSNYTIDHFKYEENLLAKENYTSLDKHINEHQKFVNKISKFLSSDLDANPYQTIADMVEFLLNWVSNHVLYSDALYVKVLKKHE